MQNSIQYAGLKILGSDLELPDSQNRSCASFITAVYGKTKCFSLNSFRAEKAKLPSLTIRLSQKTALTCTVYVLYTSSACVCFKTTSWTQITYRIWLCI